MGLFKSIEIIDVFKSIDIIESNMNGFQKGNVLININIFFKFFEDFNKK